MTQLAIMMTRQDIMFRVLRLKADWPDVPVFYGSERMMRPDGLYVTFRRFGDSRYEGADQWMVDDLFASGERRLKNGRTGATMSAKLYRFDSNNNDRCYEPWLYAIVRKLRELLPVEVPGGSD